jgi:hypothetical protein
MAQGKRLDSAREASHTFAMPETFLTFDFGTNEDAAQQARHKLEGWKQAFRLDKKLLFKFDRGDAAGPSPGENAAGEPPAKGKETTQPAKEEKPATAPSTVKLLVRLYFSDHEKLSEQRWVQRLPVDEPFKNAAPRVVPPGDPEFAATRERFESLEKRLHRDRAPRGDSA